jgi:hypothetical protein
VGKNTTDCSSFTSELIISIKNQLSKHGLAVFLLSPNADERLTRIQAIFSSPITNLTSPYTGETLIVSKKYGRLMRESFPIANNALKMGRNLKTCFEGAVKLFSYTDPETNFGMVYDAFNNPWKYQHIENTRDVAVNTCAIELNRIAV